MTSARARLRRAGAGGAGQTEAQPIPIEAIDIRDSRDVVQDGWGAAKRDFDDGSAQLAQIGDGVDLHQSAGPQDRDAVAYRLDLGELVGTEKDGLAALSGLGDAAAKLALHQGI